MVKDLAVLQASSFRVLRSEDKRNWVLQLWKMGINPKTGQIGKGYWDTEGYYGKLKDLTRSLIGKNIQVPEGNLETQLSDLLAEIKRVELSISEQLEKAMIGQDIT